MQNNQKVLMLGGGTSSSLLLRLMASSTLVPVDLLSAFAVNDVEAALALSFTTNEYRTGNTTTTFAEAFTGNSPKLTYSTTSNSTMVNSSGHLVWAPHNLVDYSEDFSQWATSGVVLDSSTVADPLGGITASTYSNFQGAANYRLFNNTVPSIVGLTQATFGIWLKGAAGETISIELDSASKSITLTGDWQYETIEKSSPATSTFYIINRSNTADVVSVWGAHVYRSDLGGMAPVPGAATGFEYYVPTNGNAVYLPRVGHHVYNGSAWVNEGLLIESEPRTNLLLQSQDLTNVSVWAAAGISPTRIDNNDGSFTLEDDSASGFEGIAQTVGITSGTSSYTASVDIKKTTGGTSKTVAINFNLNGGTQVANSVRLNTDTGTITTTIDASVQDVGDYWRVSATVIDNASGNTDVSFSLYPATDDHGGNIDDATVVGSATFRYPQLEAGSTPSSYIPTDNSTVTRGGQSLTVPPAEFGWPEPEYIGPELVDNNDFSLGDNGDWTKLNASITTEGVLDGSGGLSMLYQDVVTNGRLYHVSFDATVSTGEIEVINNDGTELFSATTSASHSFVFKHAIASGNLLWRCRSGSNAATIDNISVREINPLSVSLQMDGRMTYADEGGYSTVVGGHWREDADNYVTSLDLSTNLSDEGRVFVTQEAAGVYDSVSEASPGSFTPGVLVPFNISSRHGSTFVNGAVDGVALTANTTPTALPDLSGTDLEIAYDFMGTIGTFRQFAGDIGDTGLEKATS
jgi:hypothetical protein